MRNSGLQPLIYAFRMAFRFFKMAFCGSSVTCNVSFAFILSIWSLLSGFGRGTYPFASGNARGRHGLAEVSL